MICYRRFIKELLNYYKTINIEALTVVDMVRREYIPAVMKYEKVLCDVIISKKGAGIGAALEIAAAARISELETLMMENNEELIVLLSEAKNIKGAKEIAVFYHDKIFAKMKEIRRSVDELETLVAENYWPVPTYGDILFSVK